MTNKVNLRKFSKLSIQRLIQRHIFLLLKVTFSDKNLQCHIINTLILIANFLPSSKKNIQTHRKNYHKKKCDNKLVVPIQNMTLNDKGTRTKKKKICTNSSTITHSP